jgi:hypothetical protein
MARSPLQNFSAIPFQTSSVKYALGVMITQEPTGHG